MAKRRTVNPATQRVAKGKITKDWYQYVASVPSLAAGASLTDIINIEADANFIVVKTAYFADLAGAAQTDATRVVPLISILLTDSGSGRNLQSDPVPISSMAGIGELPYILPIPRLFKSKASLSVTFANFSAAQTYENVTLTFSGYKTFRY